MMALCSTNRERLANEKEDNLNLCLKEALDI